LRTTSIQRWLEDEKIWKTISRLKSRQNLLQSHVHVSVIGAIQIKAFILMMLKGILIKDLELMNSLDLPVQIHSVGRQIE
jgi:hypothetical protein